MPGPATGGKGDRKQGAGETLEEGLQGGCPAGGQASACPGPGQGPPAALFACCAWPPQTAAGQALMAAFRCLQQWRNH